MKSWQNGKKTIVSYSNRGKKNFLPSSHDIFHPCTRKKCICGAPCCDQPILSFVFHLLPRHRRVPLSKWRCCNEPKPLLINEKASSSAATVRSSASEPRATIHAWEPANFASSHSVTVPWHILSPGTWLLQVHLQTSIFTMLLNLQRLILPSHAFTSRLWKSNRLGRFMHVFLLCELWSSSSVKIHQWLAQGVKRKTMWRGQGGRSDWLRYERGIQRRDTSYNRARGKFWGGADGTSLLLLLQFPFSSFFLFGEGEFITWGVFVIHVVCCLVVGCEFVINALLRCFIGLQIKVVWLVFSASGFESVQMKAVLSPH